MAPPLFVGWNAIARASGTNANTLTRYHSLGLLPVQPQKIGNRVAMTQEQIEQLRRAKQ